MLKSPFYRPLRYKKHVVGFSGSRKGLTEPQRIKLEELIQSEAETLHHGDCIGADAIAHEIALALNLRIVVHPPSRADRRAYCTGPDVLVLAPRDYLDRNLDIVDECTVLIACPDGKEEKKRSGTWNAIRRARQARKRLFLVFPDGEVVVEQR